MAKQAIRTDRAPQPNVPLSQAIKAGDFVYVSGQTPKNVVTGQINGTTIEEQTAQVLENIKVILEAAGASMADVIKTTVHLSDMALFAGFNRVYSEYFPDPKPARTTVGSQLVSILVEIEAVAYIDK